METMDLKALEEQAGQLEARVGKNAADYATLRELALVYHDMALKDSKTYAKKAVQRLEEAFRKKPDDNVVVTSAMLTCCPPRTGEGRPTGWHG